jgi:hypothetical protein
MLALLLLVALPSGAMNPMYLSHGPVQGSNKSVHFKC